jgi:hypothetical protein
MTLGRANNPQRRGAEPGSGEEHAASRVHYGCQGGQVLFHMDFAKTESDGSSSRLRTRELMAPFTVILNNVPAGEYLAEFTVLDAVSGKRSAFALPFVIASR